MTTVAQCALCALVTLLACGRFGYDGGASSDASTDAGSGILPDQLGDIVRVNEAVAGLGRPTIAWTVDGFSIIWQSDTTPSEVMFSKVAADGEVLVPAKVLASDPTKGYFAGSIDSAEGVTGTAFVSDADPGELWFAPLDPDGAGPAPRQLYSAQAVKQTSVAVGHGEYLVSSAYEKGIAVATVPEDFVGEQVKEHSIDPGEPHDAQVVATDTGFMMVWTDGREPGQRGIYGAAVGVDGVVPSDFAIVMGLDNVEGPTLARSGSKVGIAWAEVPVNPEIPTVTRFVSIEAESLEIGDVRMLFQGSQLVPVIDLAGQKTGEQFAIVAERGRDIAAMLLVDENTMVSALINTEGATSTFPAIAWGEDRYGLVWIEVAPSGKTELRFRWLMP